MKLVGSARLYKALILSVYFYFFLKEVNRNLYLPSICLHINPLASSPSLTVSTLVCAVPLSDFFST